MQPSQAEDQFMLAVIFMLKFRKDKKPYFKGSRIYSLERYRLWIHQNGRNQKNLIGIQQNLPYTYQISLVLGVLIMY